MKTDCIILLVSEQTIPNVLFLKWYFNNHEGTEAVSLVFVSTEEMERKNKSDCIFSAAENIAPPSTEKIIIKVDRNNPDTVKDALKKIYEEKSLSTACFFVNITGGTKMMSLGVYSAFNNIKNALIFYQPIGKDVNQICPASRTFPINDIATLDEYFKAYGIQYRQDSRCERDWNYNKCVYKLVIKQTENFRKLMQTVQNAPHFKNKMHKKGFLDFTNTSPEDFQEKEFENFQKPENNIKDTICQGILRFKFKPEKLTYAQQKYITGGWFEEYVYQKLKMDLDLADSKIWLNVKVQKDDAKNELDIVYIKDNALNIIECKSFINEDAQVELLNNTLYKVRALESQFGLSAKSYLYTKSSIKKQSIINRAELFGIEIVDGSKI